MNSIQELLDRFYNFYDGFIESIAIEYCKEGDMSIKIMVSSKDSISEKEGGWANIQLTIHGARDMRFQETWRTTNAVLTDGIKINKIENLFYIEFGGRCLRDCQSDGLDEFLEDFWKSDAYVVGKSLNVRINNSDADSFDIS